MATWHSSLTNVKNESIEKEQLLKDCLAAAERGSLNSWAEAVISGKLEADLEDATGNTVLHSSVLKLSVETTQKLINEGVCAVDMRNRDGKTPLMLATSTGNYALIKLFLDKGADIEAKDSAEMTPLLITAQQGHIGVFLVLLYMGADVTAVDTNGCNVVHWAAYRNRVPFLRMLKAYTLALDVPDHFGMTPLHRACISNALESIEFLLSNGVPSDSKDKYGRTPSKVSIEFKTEGPSEYILNFSQEEYWFIRYFGLTYILFWGLIWYTYYNFMLYKTADYLWASLLFVICGLLAIPVYFLLKMSDCNVIPKQADSMENSLVKSFGEMFEKREFESIPDADNVCFTCFLLRPQRSKHCRVCDKCIPKQDHHCIFVNKCISDSNRRLFVGGLTLHLIGLACYAFLFWKMLESELSELDFEGIPRYTTKLFYVFVNMNPLLFLALSLWFLVFWYSFWYLFLEFHSISQGLTANEVLNRHRYIYLFKHYASIDGFVKPRFKNPFTEGFIKNWQNFLLN